MPRGVHSSHIPRRGNAMEYSFDLTRILLGSIETAHPVFYLEVILRTIVMYLYTIFLARMVGQGGIGQIGPFEFVLVSPSDRRRATRCSIPMSGFCRGCWSSPW
jgi:hypothetical protein